jgi:hypothetical protein
MMKMQTIFVLALACMATTHASYEAGDLKWESYNHMVHQWLDWPEASRAAVRSSYDQYIAQPQQPHSPCIDGGNDILFSINWKALSRTSCHSLDHAEEEKIVQPMRTLVAHVAWQVGTHNLAADSAQAVEQAYQQWRASKTPCPCIHSGGNPALTSFRVDFKEMTQVTCEESPAGSPSGMRVQRSGRWEVQTTSGLIKTHDDDDGGILSYESEGGKIWLFDWIWLAFACFCFLMFTAICVACIRQHSKPEKTQVLMRYGVMSEDIQPGMVVLSEQPNPATLV